MNEIDPAYRLVGSEPCSVVLPAGCGKTQLLVRAAGLAADTDGRQLVLTHTNAGVRAVRDKSAELGLAPGALAVATIDGFCLRLAAMRRPGTYRPPPAALNYPNLRREAVAAMENRHIRATVTRSYSGLFVDEYQDCSSIQHDLVLSLERAGLTPRVVGDPLQAIFRSNDDDPIVTWDLVSSAFPEVAIQRVPWRWRDRNPSMGDWALALHDHLREEAAQPPSPACVSYLELEGEPLPRLQQLAAAASEREGTVLILREGRAERAHELARRIPGFRSIERAHLSELRAVADEMDRADTAAEAAIAILQRVLDVGRRSRPVRNTLESLRAGNAPAVDGRTAEANRRLYVAAQGAMEGDTQSVKSVGLAALQLVEPVSRPEYALALRYLVEVSDDKTYVDAAEEFQSRRRSAGSRSRPRLLVSTPYLIKGLEFDEVIVYDWKALRSRQLKYVACTRAVHRLTVLSGQ